MEQMGDPFNGGRVAGNIPGAFPPGALQDLAGFEFPDFFFNLPAAGGAQDMGDVLKHFDVDAAVSERNNRSKGSIALPADEHVVSFAGLFHDADSLEPGVFFAAIKIPAYAVKGASDGFGSFNPRDDAACV